MIYYIIVYQHDQTQAFSTVAPWLVAIVGNAMETLFMLLCIYARQKLSVNFPNNSLVIQSAYVFFVATLIQL